jgi:glucan phosphoethanolaminetransferase (alkaline phosphatase superfamily)
MSTSAPSTALRPSGSTAAFSALRRRAAWLRRGAWGALALPLLAIWLVDASHRATRMALFDARDAFAYALASALSLLLWASLLVLASARRGWPRHAFATAIVVLAAVTVGGQIYAYAQYAAYIHVDAVVLGTALRASVFNQLAADLPHLATHLVPPALLALTLVLIARRSPRPRRSLRRLATVTLPVTLLFIFVSPGAFGRLQPVTPDVLFLHASGRAAAHAAGILSSSPSAPPQDRVSLPPLVPTASRPRNVVLVIDESIRADVTCIDHDPACEVTPHSNAAAPKRIGLRQLRALDSATLVSLGVLWSGLSPLMSNADRATHPQLFHVTRAAGLQSGYVTSQNLDFAGSRALIEVLPIDRFVEARDLVDEPDIDLGAPDELTAAKAVEVARALKEPFLLVVQFANVHYPFRTDPARSPFQPSAITKDATRSEEFFNHYKNAVHLHDRATGALVRGLRALPSSERTVILYTSDHGESFGEHGQYGHTLSIFDEEVRVPGWIDAPDGTLTDHERQRLLEARDAFTWHADFAPTILDLLGLWDAPELSSSRFRMIGTSLLRGRTTRPVPITNCTEQWGCAFRNWGVMHEGRKLEARAWDPDWRCYDVLRDPGERVNLGPAACPSLVHEANKLYGEKPGD